MRLRIMAVLAGLGVVTACGPVAAPAASAPAATTPAAPASSTAAAAASTPAAPSAPVPATPLNTTPKRADLLNGVSCAGQECVAVGAYYSGTAGERTLVERWTGSAWQVEPSPDGPRYSSLQAVSCPAGQGCVAVGSPVLSQAGGTWRVTMPSSLLTAVSCATATACMAVGLNAGYAFWDGTAWQAGALVTPVPAAPPPHRGEQTTIAGVSCVSASWCLAVGDYSYGAGASQDTGSYRDRILAEAWNGTRWRLLPTTDVGPVDALSAVWCTAPGDCVAVGASARQYPLAEHWNGTSWQVQSMPVPGRIGYTQLTSVWCAGSGGCVAAGSYQGTPLAEVLDGGGWRLEWLPAPPGENNSAQLNDVSCTSPDDCVAVGASGDGLSYAERYNGTRWIMSSTQNP